jgi:hypothetical protein
LSGKDLNLQVEISMMEKKSRQLYLVLIFGILILLAGILLALNAYKSLEDPQTCNICHEMEPFVASYLKPEQGSTIEKHKLDCLGCHTNISPAEARSAVIKEIEIGTLNKIAGVQLNTSTSALAVNCIRCHLMKEHFNASNNTSCQGCHWAHNSLTTNKSPSVIPYGPHKNQTCQKCHGTTFVIPRCINCHSGHGGQKLENDLCLECHTDPHVPKKPGILPDNTVKFTENLPFSVCQPCHENEYFNLTNTRSLHTDMQTCALCHKYHGLIPNCNECHPGMMLERHVNFECKDCHIRFDPVKITCPDCHGRSHEWSAFTAVLNPK